MHRGESPQSLVHVKETYNTEAAHLSRQPIRQGEWELNSEVFLLVSQHFGRPKIDRFACRKNGKVRRFFSLARERGFQRVDSLAQRWEFGLAYAFFSQGTHPRVLQKLSQAETAV